MSASERFHYGEINCHYVTYSRSLRRYVEKRLGRWIDAQGEAASGKRIAYQVNFDRRGGGHEVSCEIYLRIDDQYVHLAENGTSPFAALMNCLSLEEARLYV